MKKLLIILSILCIFLLSGSYLVGKKAKTEINLIFSRTQNSKLLHYEKSFFTATAVSEVAINVQGRAPIVFKVTSNIQHYPYKAVIHNNVQAVDPEVNRKLASYFGHENWLKWSGSVNLLGKLTGKVTLLSGEYQGKNEHISTEPVRGNYQVNLKDYSGKFALHWGGASIQNEQFKANVNEVELVSNFLSSLMGSQYQTKISELNIEQQQVKIQSKGILLQGNSQLGEKANTLDSHNEWQVASYLVDDHGKKLFTDNHLQLDLKGLSITGLGLLKHLSEQPDLAAKGLVELVSSGGEISLQQVSSQTPWGKVQGNMNLLLQAGGNLPEMLDNPFMLLDYTAGNANILLPESLLKVPAFMPALQIAVQSGLLKREKQTLILNTQLQRGELTVNGQVIPM